ncbi:MAG: hypothetical protein PHX48_01270 [Bacteroidales bacterium]|nr:hypothetical protein [Bacteroidales bacterium]
MRNGFIILLLIGVSNITNLYSQNREDAYCNRIISQADSLFNEVGNLKESILLYTQAYYECGNKEVEFNLSKAHALLGNKDSAFYHLNNVFEKDSTSVLFNIGEYYLLIKDKRWEKVIDKQLEKIQAKSGKIKKIDLAKRLIDMRIKDQSYYYYIAKLPYSRELANKYWPIKNKLNKKNLKELRNIIIENDGWPKISEVSSKVSGAAFLIIQHSDPQTMQFYYRYFRECVDEGEAEKKHLALMTDRMINDLGVKQIYGTQIGFDDKTGIYYLDLNDVIDPINLNKRRAEMDLKPIEEYLKNWDAELRNIPKDKE